MLLLFFSWTVPEFGSAVKTVVGAELQEAALRPVKPLAPHASSSVLLVLPLLVRRGTDRPAGRAGRAAGRRSAAAPTPEPSAPPGRNVPGRDAPPTFSPPVCRSPPAVWASPAGQTRRVIYII